MNEPRSTQTYKLEDFIFKTNTINALKLCPITSPWNVLRDTSVIQEATHFIMVGRKEGKDFYIYLTGNNTICGILFLEKDSIELNALNLHCDKISGEIQLPFKSMEAYLYKYNLLQLFSKESVQTDIRNKWGKVYFNLLNSLHKHNSSSEYTLEWKEQNNIYIKGQQWGDEIGYIHTQTPIILNINSSSFNLQFNTNSLHQFIKEIFGDFVKSANINSCEEYVTYEITLNENI